MNMKLFLLFIFCLFKFNKTHLVSYGQDVFDETSGLWEGDTSEDQNGNCRYSNWSKWSECTGNCIDFEHIPTKYRTRKVVDYKYENCVNDNLGTLQIEICTNLPPCKSGSWIKNYLSEVKIIETYDKVRKQTKNIYPEWVLTAIRQYPSIIKDENRSEITELISEKIDKKQKENNKENNKYKFDIIKSVKRTSLTQIKCGCPARHTPIMFWEFINNQILIDKLSQLCVQNKYNQLVFEDNGRYIYYCNIGMIIKEVESHELTCDSLDSTEYVPCKRKAGKGNIAGGWVDKVNNFIVNILSFSFVLT